MHLKSFGVQREVSYKQNMVFVNPYKAVAGTELDECVHSVLGSPSVEVPEYSKCEYAAKSLVKSLKKKLRTKVKVGRASRGMWFAQFGTDPSTSTEVLADSMPLAVSRMAVLSLGASHSPN